MNNIDEQLIRNKYFKWLCNLVGFDNNYSILARAMHRKEFYSIVKNDNNRAEDGKKIRELFIKDVVISREYSEDYLENILGGPCSVLEMMIALSFRMEEILYECEEDGQDRSVQYFWQMIKNLELDEFTNEEYSEDELFVVDMILDDLLERRYKRSGVGGLFPLRNYKKDQRTVEIWYQMMSYLTENYSI